MAAAQGRVRAADKSSLLLFEWLSLRWKVSTPSQNMRKVKPSVFQDKQEDLHPRVFVLEFKKSTALMMQPNSLAFQ